MEEKVDGLNFLPVEKKPFKMRTHKRVRIPENIQMTQNQQIPQESPYIYESQSNQKIIYISVNDTKGNKICYSYYLCELLHLIDKNNYRNFINGRNLKKYMD